MTATLSLFDRTSWKRVRFGDVVENGAETCDPEQAGLERLVAMEHLEPGSLHVRSWGNAADGTTFTRRCRPGQVLFGKRRAYQRKVAAFEAVVSGDICVLVPKHDRLLPELLPFCCLSERFFQHAVGTSASTASPAVIPNASKTSSPASACRPGSSPPSSKPAPAPRWRPGRCRATGARRKPPPRPASPERNAATVESAIRYFEGVMPSQRGRV